MEYDFQKIFLLYKHFATSGRILALQVWLAEQFSRNSQSLTKSAMSVLSVLSAPKVWNLGAINVRDAVEATLGKPGTRFILCEMAHVVSKRKIHCLVVFQSPGEKACKLDL